MRRAYLDRARALHPDRFAGAPVEERRRVAAGMQEVNEAWRVLRDPARRVAYDRALANARSGAGPGPRPAGREPGPHGPSAPGPGQGDGELVDVAPPVGPGWAQVLRALPWAVVLLALGLIFVFTAYATGGRDQGVVGECVTASSGPGASTVPCGTPGARRVTAVVEAQRACPAGDARLAWGDDGSAVCVAP